MPPFTIREAEARDLPDVAELFRAYAAELPIDLNLQGFASELAELPGDYALPLGALLIAQDGDGSAVGSVGLRPLGQGVSEMKRLYVRPEARHTGLGRALAVAVIEAARERGYREMKLDTLAQLERAMALYRSLGFTLIEPYGHHPYPGTVCFGRML